MAGKNFDAASVDHILTTTRAVRKRLDLERRVEPEVIEECLRIAIQAPTGSNLQRWRWVVVTDPERRKLIAEAYRRGSGPYHDVMKAAMRDDDQQSARVWGSSRYLEDILEDVPALVIPCHLGAPGEMRELLKALGYPHEIPENMVASSFYGSVWPSVWSFMLALRTRGLGSALTTLHLLQEREVGDILDIPDTVTQVGLIPVAYYKGESFKPAKRRAAEEITYWNGWKKPR